MQDERKIDALTEQINLYANKTKAQQETYHEECKKNQELRTKISGLETSQRELNRKFADQV